MLCDKSLKFIITHRLAIAFALIFALTILVYLPSLHGDFLDWDDTDQVSQNIDIRQLSLPAVKKIFTSFYAQMYQPIATLSFALEYRLAGTATQTYHLDNIFLHLLNVLLVYSLTKKLFSKTPVALMACALFAVWPTQVEVVSWISARSTLLAGGFTLAALSCYFQYNHSDKKRFYWLSFLLFILAVLSKSVAASIPLLLCLLDYFQNKKFNWRIIFNKLPFLLISVTIGLIAIVARKSIGTLTYSVYDWPDRIILILYTASFQAYKAVVPLFIHAFYVHPADSKDRLYWWVYLSALLPPLGIFLAYLRRRRKLEVFWLAWFLLNIALSIQLAPYITIAGADRYNYLAVLALIWPISLLADRYHKIGRLSIVMLALILSYNSWGQAHTWKNDYNLWQNVLDNDPQSAMAYMNQGQARAKLNDPFGARDDYLISLALMPNQPETLNLKGSLELSVFRRADLAAKDFDKAIRINNDDSIYFYNRGLALAALKNYPQAIADFNQAIKLETAGKKTPKVLASANYSLAIVLGYGQNQKAALEKADQAIGFDPRMAEAWYLKGTIKNNLAKGSGCTELRQAAGLGWEAAKAPLNNCPK